MENNLLVKMSAIMGGIQPQDVMRVLKKCCLSSTRGEVSDEEMIAFMAVAAHYQLNPLLRQIVGFVGKSGAVVPVVTIDGWIALARRNEDYLGIHTEEIVENGQLVGVSATVMRQGKPDQTFTEYWSEVSRGSVSTAKETHPRRFLRHKAIAQAIRMAYGVSGIYEEGEARDVLEALDNAATVRMPVAADAPRLEGVPVRQGPIENQVVEEPQPVARSAAGPVITEAQVKRLWAIAFKTPNGKERVRAILNRLGLDSTADIPRDQYDDIVAEIQRPE